MPGFDVGGPTPLPDHHVLSVRAPTGTRALAPVQRLTPLAITGYNSYFCADGEAPAAFAIGRVTLATAPVGALMVGGKHSVINVQYTGTAPATGTTITASPDGKVQAAGTGKTGIGIVMEIDYANERLDLFI
jgi:hypothetical protein